MMTQPRSEQDDFLDLLQSFYEKVALSDDLKRLRAKAWEHFLELGLPSRQSEVFRYIKLRQLFGRTYEHATNVPYTKAQVSPHVLPECRKSHIVFINGHYDADLSDVSGLKAGVVVSCLNDAIRPYGALLTNQWTKAAKEETDPFAALNAALHSQGVFVYVPLKSEQDVPIQLLNIIKTDGCPLLIQPRLQVFMGPSSSATFVSTLHQEDSSGYCVNGVVDFTIEDNAHVKYSQVTTDLAPDVWAFDALRASLKNDSTLKSVVYTDGAATVRSDYRVLLTGTNGDACLNGVWMLDEKREAHTHVLIDHQAPNCRSNQLFKGVLTDISRSSFEGKILVQQRAQKTEAYQLNNNLLLSDQANADSKPNLEIFADDVKASHGATMGQLDAEQLFYMKTRGFSSAEAKNMLVYGYSEEVIEQIPVTSLRDAIATHARSFLA